MNYHNSVYLTGTGTMVKKKKSKKKIYLNFITVLNNSLHCITMFKQ